MDVIKEYDRVKLLVRNLQQLNPNCEFGVGNIELDSLALDRIFSSVPGNQLLLPFGYKYIDGIGISNCDNHNPLVLRVRDISMVKKERLEPLNIPNNDIHSIKNIEKPKNEQIIYVKQAIVKSLNNVKDRIMNGVNTNGKSR